jgi:hypothetical protein
VCAVHVIQYSSTTDHRALSLRDQELRAHSPDHGSPDPKHVVSEGFLILAEAMRPEATLLIGLSYYASQPGKGVIIYVGRVSVGRRLNR